MKVTKSKENDILTVELEENGDILSFNFGGNLDLYWCIHSKDKIENRHKRFIITKENYGIYNLFERLYSDIENINIYDDMDEEDKLRIQKFTNYNELFHKISKTITWYSDETAHEVGNYLIIKKLDDSFELNFYTQEHIFGYDRDFNNAHYIPIRFRNSGSFYHPFKVVFMKMYNGLNEVDDINDIGHQLHMEEFLYTLDHPKVFVKK